MTSLLGFTLAAALLTVVPGLDTMLVLRTAIAQGSRSAMIAGLGIAGGCLTWGLLTAVGLAALVSASATAFEVVKWLGAIYVVYLGLRFIISDRSVDVASQKAASTSATRINFTRGYFTNLLNPKVGIFYVSFLPQFISSHANVLLLTLAMALIHAMLGVLWFAVLCTSTRLVASTLKIRGVVRWTNRLVGALFVAIGVRLAFESA